MHQLCVYLVILVHGPSHVAVGSDDSLKGLFVLAGLLRYAGLGSTAEVTCQLPTLTYDIEEGHSPDNLISTPSPPRRSGWPGVWKRRRRSRAKEEYMRSFVKIIKLQAAHDGRNRHRSYVFYPSSPHLFMSVSRPATSPDTHPIFPMLKRVGQVSFTHPHSASYLPDSSFWGLSFLHLY